MIAIALAAGYHLATGKYGVVYMQNSGIGNAINPLVSLADEDVYNIPMLIIVGWRGEPGKSDEPQHKKQGKVTLALFKSIGIKTLILDDNYQQQIDYCYDSMKKTNKSIALIVKNDTFDNYKHTVSNNGYQLTREEALDTILSRLSEDDFIVSTTGKTSREIFEIREKNNQSHCNDFLTVGSMGHASSLALGVSFGTDKNVYCIDGDGALLMHMGGMAIVSQNAKDNFKYILINNGAHESVGGQPTVALDINIGGLLRDLGFKNIYEVKTKADLEKNILKLQKENLSAMIVYVKQGSRAELGRPTTTAIENKEAFIRKLKGDKK